MTKLSGKRWVFVQVGIHNTSRKIHLSKLNFAKTKTNKNVNYNINSKRSTLNNKNVDRLNFCSIENDADTSKYILITN